MDDGDPELGEFSPWSWWPIVLAGSAAVFVVGLAVGHVPAPDRARRSSSSRSSAGSTSTTAATSPAEQHHIKKAPGEFRGPS
ncbi:MAG: cytochrome c oxidase subunit 4 [Candidatus Microbacterium colombiense]|nr:MAG: cytochrome c oxidase subunit 4 [Microbacterium sp.]